MFPRRVLVENQSPVTIRDRLELLGLEPTTRSTTSLYESVSTSDEVACWCTFLSGGCKGCWRPIELYSKLPMYALIIATFSAFFPLKVILWWEKYKDSSSILKDDSLSKLYCPTQSMSLYSRFSCSNRSLSVSSLILILLTLFYLRKVTNIFCYKLFGDNVFIWKPSNSLTVPTD